MMIVNGAFQYCSACKNAEIAEDDYLRCKINGMLMEDDDWCKQYVEDEQEEVDKA